MLAMAVLQTPARAFALRCVQALRDHGHVAYFVGGCVRDQLMGFIPKDFDIATDATPDRVQAIFSRTIPIGKVFGVIMVLDPDHVGVQVEVATFRADGVYEDGRHPDSVRYSTAAEDAQRRDFTINGLFYDPITDEVLDYVDGRADIKRRVIRAIGSARERFAEDKLRVLRAIRFACRFTFAIDPATFAAIHEFTPSLSQVSWERIREELDGIFAGSGRGRAFGLLLETGALEYLLPELSQVLVRDVSVAAQVSVALDLLDSRHLTPELAWAALLWHVHGGDPSPPLAALGVLKRLRKSNLSVAATIEMLTMQSGIKRSRDMSLATLKRMLRREHVAPALELFRVLAIASGEDIGGADFCAAHLDEFRRSGLEAALWPKMPIDGTDLKHLGLRPGPEFSLLLEAVEDEVLEGRVTDREQALAFVRRRNT